MKPTPSIDRRRLITASAALAGTAALGLPLTALAQKTKQPEKAELKLTRY